MGASPGRFWGLGTAEGLLSSLGPSLLSRPKSHRVALLTGHETGKVPPSPSPPTPGFLCRSHGSQVAAMKSVSHTHLSARWRAEGVGQGLADQVKNGPPSGPGWPTLQRGSLQTPGDGSRGPWAALQPWSALPCCFCGFLGVGGEGGNWWSSAPCRVSLSLQPSVSSHPLLSPIQNPGIGSDLPTRARWGGLYVRSPTDAICRAPRGRPQAPLTVAGGLQLPALIYPSEGPDPAICRTAPGVPNRGATIHELAL